MAIRPAHEPLDDVPARLTDGSRLVGVVTEGVPVYHDSDDAVLRPTRRFDESSVDADDGSHRQSVDPGESYRHPIDSDESVADVITTVEKHHGWALLSEYGLEHLTDE